MDEYFGFVLSLSESDRNTLLPVITNLQHKYCNQPPFEPHLSIYHSVKLTSLRDAITAITQVTNDIQPFSIEADGIDSQDTWAKILYIKIKPNQILDSLHSDIGRELKDLEVRSFTPHISLMYKDHLADATRTEIVAGLNLPKTYTINGIQIISPGTVDNDWRDYTKWQVLHSITFSN